VPVNANYSGPHWWVGQAVRVGKLGQKIIAVQTEVDSISAGSNGEMSDTGTAEAGGIATTFAWGDQAGTLTVMVDADLAVLDRVQRARWCPGTFGAGTAVAHKLTGLVAVPAGLSATMPKGRTLFVGRGQTFTWEGDSSANKLVTGDWRRPVGTRLYGSEYILLNLTLPVIGMI